MEDADLHISWSNGDWFVMNGFLGMCRENALDYFCQQGNPFYERNCINEQVKLQRLEPSSAVNFVGHEYVLLTAASAVRSDQEQCDDAVYVVRRQYRSSPDMVETEAEFYILHPGVIYKVPDVATLLNSKLLGVAHHLRLGFERIFPIVSHSLADGGRYSWLADQARKKSRDWKPVVPTHASLDIGMLLKMFDALPTIQAAIAQQRMASEQTASGQMADDVDRDIPMDGVHQ